MSQLVKARGKRLEDMPEWYRVCCLAARPTQPEMVLDLGDVVVNVDHICWQCGAKMAEGVTGAKAVSGRRAGHYISLDVVDLDEGPIAEQP